MKQLRTIIPIILGAFLVFATSFFISQDSFALGIIDGMNAARGNGQPTELFGSGGVVRTVTNILLFFAGALSVIMLIVGGLRYTISGGNSTAVTAAKNTVLMQLSVLSLPSSPMLRLTLSLPHLHLALVLVSPTFK